MALKTNDRSVAVVGRRAVLRAAAALMAAPGMGALAQTAPDYKALVCVFLAGGNDGHNTVVPLEPRAYAEYRRIRGGLALPDGSAQLLSVATGSGVPYGLNSGLAAIAPLWGQRRLAIVANVGALTRPTTRAEILAGTARLPSNLYSHSDQMQVAQVGDATGGGGTGWGGRIADAVAARNGASRFPSAVSTAGRAVFAIGNTFPSASLVPGFDLTFDGMNTWPDSAAQARQRGLAEVLAADNGMRLVQSANQVRQDALELNRLLRSGSGTGPTTPFPGTDIGRQLREVARVMSLRGATGVRRQIFFCQLGGFDTHSGQSWMQWDLLRQLGEAVAAFHAATIELGVDRQVVTFTQSEFGRTLQPSGSGSDHGWGNHHFVLGGAVNGGELYGHFPFPALGGGDDANSRGALIPTTSWEQLGSTLATWFGASAEAVTAAFPNIGAFAARDLGFLAV